MKLAKLKIKKVFLSIFIGLVTVSSLLEINNNKNKISNKISSYSIDSSKSNSFKESNNNIASEEEMNIAREWSQKILKGGYILFFRHAEREKWTDVIMYDALETDLHNNGINESRYAENTYFSKAVCLNSRGKVQAKAMKEVIDLSKLPIGFRISSPSCRARQTANEVFGGYDKLDKILLHKGPYYENMNQRKEKLRDFVLSLPLQKDKNTIISAHNGVVDNNMFTNMINNGPLLELEEGGFYIISKEGGDLILEYEFNNFAHFSRNFFPR